MSSITAVAEKFFHACETGQGWKGCSEFCQPDATFSSQAEPLAEFKKLEQYTEWMKGVCATLPDSRYEIKSMGTDDARQNVAVFGVFTGTHTGEGGPCPPTGRRTRSDYVYVMDFDGDRIRHLTKIWNAGWAMKELGWG